MTNIRAHTRRKPKRAIDPFQAEILRRFKYKGFLDEAARRGWQIEPPEYEPKTENESKLAGSIKALADFVKKIGGK